MGWLNEEVFVQRDLEGRDRIDEAQDAFEEELDQEIAEECNHLARQRKAAGAIMRRVPGGQGGKGEESGEESDEEPDEEC